MCACNVHAESYSPARHGQSVVAEDGVEGRGIWNPILNIGPYVTIDIDTARGKSSGQRCGGCCVRTRESQGQGAHCTVYSVLYSVHLLGLGCGDMVIATATATSSTQHCSDPGTITWTQPSPSHHLLICDHLILLLGDCDSGYHQGDGCCCSQGGLPGKTSQWSQWR